MQTLAQDNTHLRPLERKDTIHVVNTRPMPKADPGFWDYVKSVARNLWAEKPWLVIIFGIFLLIGIIRSVGRIFRY